MNLLEKCIVKLTNEEQKIKIAFVEGNSSRVIKAAKQLDSKNILEPILIFKSNQEFEDKKEELGKSSLWSSNEDGIKHFILENESAKLEELAKQYETIRKGKESYEKSLSNMSKPEFVAAMLINSGDVDGAIGGVHLPTSKILVAAFKAIGAKEGVKTVSSVMLMAKGEEIYLFGDISVNPDPDPIALADIAQNANEFAIALDMPEKVAFLSFSTSGSATTLQTKKMIAATKEFNSRKCSKYPAIGEVQFDAAFDLGVKKQKYQNENDFDGTASVFIFPDLNSGNIGYKIAQRMGGWSTMGPIITGLKKPYNDLSRGSTTENVIDSAIITAVQALKAKGSK